MNLAKASKVLQDLARLVRAMSLYPVGHPVVQEGLARLEELVRSIEGKDGKASADFLVHQDSFFFKKSLLSKESITFRWFMKLWESKGIYSISIPASASKQDLTELVLFLSNLGSEPEGAVAVNAAKLLAVEDAPHTQLVRRLYGETLDITRGIGAELAAGAAPPLGAAKGTINRLIDGILEDPESALLLSTMHSHDEQTFFHMVNVCILAVSTGSEIGLEREQLNILGMAGLLHDIGKVSVPAEVLSKSGPLTDDDWEQIRQHPVEGAGMLLRSWDRISPVAARVSYEHHMRLDGGGYPAHHIDDGKPDLMSRVVSVVDTFDAMTSRRPYRRAEQRQRALEVLASGAGSHYDPRVVRVFIRMLGLFPPGSVVQLSDGSTAVVLRNNPDAPESPSVRLARTAKGALVTEVAVLDLSANGKANSIISTLDPLAAGVDPADYIE